MTASVTTLPNASSRLFATIDALPGVSASVQPDRGPGDYTHQIAASTDDQARAIAARLLTDGHVNTFTLAGGVLRVRVNGQSR